MKTVRNILIIILLFGYGINLYGQKSKIDSLWNVYKNAKHDTVRILLLNEKIGFLYERFNPDSAILCYEKAVGLADKNLSGSSSNFSTLQQLFSVLKARAIRYVGIVYYEQGSYDKAIQNFQKSLKLFEELVAQCTEKRLKLISEDGMAQCYNNIGNIHYDQGSFDKAIEYFLKSLKIHEVLSAKSSMAGCYVNIGNVYFDQGLYDKSTEYYFKSLKLSEEVGDKRGMAKCYNNVGNVLLTQGKYEKVMDYYLKSLKIKEEFKDKNGVAMVTANIAALHLILADSGHFGRVGHLKLAVEYSLKAMAMAREINALPLVTPVASTLMSAYKKLNNFKKAMEYAEIFIATKDSMYKEEKTKSIADAEKKFESEKKQLEIDKLNKDKELQNSELLRQKEQGQRQKMVIWFVVVGLFLVVVFAIFIVQRLRITRRQKQIIEKQKMLVDEKNMMLNQQNEEISAQRDEIESQRDEITAQRDLVTDQRDHIEEQKQKITDSINYAKRIQQAVLPAGDSANNILGEHFIFFKPKDIVSGDFYWGTRINEWLIVTVADCTGHGVPGAFMSMLGVSFLNEIVRKKEITKASEVLDNLRKSIIEALHQKGQSGEQKDGMDIAFCALNTQTNILHFAGANNSLYIVSKSTKLKVESELSAFDFSLYELKGDKQPVSIYENMKAFTNHEIQLNAGDCIYLASDGFEDQFGGPKNRKFMAKQLKELIVSFSDKSMSEQLLILTQTYENWKGKHEQIDDVTLMGLKI